MRVLQRKKQTWKTKRFAYTTPSILFHAHIVQFFACNEGPKRRYPVRRRFSSIFEMEDIAPNECNVKEGFNGEREEVCEVTSAKPLALTPSPCREDGDHGRATERGDSAVFDKRSSEKDRRQYEEVWTINSSKNTLFMPPTASPLSR
jgi:hypothetical protein